MTKRTVFTVSVGGYNCSLMMRLFSNHLIKTFIEHPTQQADEGASRFGRTGLQIEFLNVYIFQPDSYRY
jgi:hypothetical protein